MKHLTRKRFTHLCRGARKRWYPANKDWYFRDRNFVRGPIDGRYDFYIVSNSHKGEMRRLRKAGFEEIDNEQWMELAEEDLFTEEAMQRAADERFGGEKALDGLVKIAEILQEWEETALTF